MVNRSQNYSFIEQDILLFNSAKISILNKKYNGALTFKN